MSHQDGPIVGTCGLRKAEQGVSHPDGQNVEQEETDVVLMYRL